MLCYGEGRQQVSRRHVKLAAGDTQSGKRAGWRWPWLAGAGLTLLAAACGLTWTLSK